MRALLEVLNHPAEAFRNKHKAVAWGFVIITILINSVMEPLLQCFWGFGRPKPDIIRMLTLTGLGLVSYLGICFILWIVCKLFGSKATYWEHVCSWGITYSPTALCAVTVAFTEVFFEVFWNNSVWGLLINIIFGAVLIWKIILYILYLRELPKLRGWRFAGALIIIGICILILARWNASVGLKTPVL